MKKIALVALAAASITVVPNLTGSAGATNIGNEGCTPGYWKNHTENWLEDDVSRSYETDQTLRSVFGVDSDVTLLEALQGGGGKGVDGARKVLARAAVAAVLNAAHEGLGYPLRRGGATGLLTTVPSTWISGDRDAILALAAELDGLNNLGCPLN